MSPLTKTMANPKFDQRIGLLFSLPKFLNSEFQAIWSYNCFSPFFEVVLQEYREQSKLQALLDWTWIRCWGWWISSIFKAAGAICAEVLLPKPGFMVWLIDGQTLHHGYSEPEQEADKWNSCIHLFTLHPYTGESPLIVTDVPSICRGETPRFFSYQTSGCLTLFSHNSVTVSNSNASHRQAGYASMGSGVKVIFFDSSIHFFKFNYGWSMILH